ncbi:HAD family hydrolase [Ethanoligenens harbinense]|uniref:HAD family hydrolase n=1 Tax=Ethanoligenens harbinense TaxID=253239 RepID=UPI000EA1E221|nr:HAD-IA family hydrolase [Ethanoligenens harbinense]AYF41771.1 hypothetical protein CN246_09115 [Ethanoligenens harbinense]
MKCILFDLGYTLIYSIKHEIYTGILRETGHPFDIQAVDDAFQKADAHLMHYFPGLLMKSSSCFGDAYLTLVNYHLDIFPPIRPYADLYSRAMADAGCIWKPYDDTYAVLDALKENGLRLGLVTNWGLNCRAVLEQMGLDTYFDAVVVSSEVGIEKPDARIILRALQSMEVKAEDALFIGDNYYDDGVGSQRAGVAYFILERGNAAGPSGYPSIHGLTEVLHLAGLKEVET